MNGKMSFPNHTSPSNLSLYKICPKRWKWHYLDKRRNVHDTNESANVGKFVHEVLEQLYQLPQYDRTLKNARSISKAILPNFRKTLKVLPDTFKWDAWYAIEGLWDLEQPRTIDVQSTEFKLEGPILDEINFLGYVDRVDNDGDNIHIVDYKTGRLPAKAYRSEKMRQLRLYALAMAELFGKVPVLLKIHYLGKETLQHKIKPGDIKRTATWLSKTYDGIKEAYDKNEFPAKPGPLCGYCPYLQNCDEGYFNMYKRTRPKFD